MGTVYSKVRKNVILNNEGFEVFQISRLAQFRRFLILGTDSGTFYVTPSAFTEQNTDNLRKIFNSDEAITALDMLQQISIEALAPRVSPILFALAIAASSNNKATRKHVLAYKYFSSIVRTQSHLFEFLGYARNNRGMGRLLREAVRRWYQYQTAEKLAYQVVKYRSRFGYTTRDVLRLVKPVPADEGHDEIYGFTTGKSVELTIPLLKAYKQVSNDDIPNPEIIKQFNLPWEALPTEWLNYASVWETLMWIMPYTAMIKNLNKATSIGLFEQNPTLCQNVCTKILNIDVIKASRIHPFTILIAYTTYMQGYGFRGNLRWTPNKEIVKALEQAFYKAFVNVEPTNKRILIGLDVSTSMRQTIMGSCLTAATASAALVLLLHRRELNCSTVAFSSNIIPFHIEPKYKLKEVMNEAHRINYGSTNIPALIRYAINSPEPFDSIIVITDNETNVRDTATPAELMKLYRKKRVADAKLIVMGMTATRFSVADPDDPNMLDVVGFDASVPLMIKHFIEQ